MNLMVRFLTLVFIAIITNLNTKNISLCFNLDQLLLNLLHVLQYQNPDLLSLLLPLAALRDQGGAAAVLQVVVD